MAMLIGTHELWLNKNCAFRLPKRIACALCADSGQKELCFAAARHLRCYSMEGARAYMDALIECGDARSLTWARLTAANGAALVSFGNMLHIPDALCSIYGYKPEMKITLLGCGNYIELYPA